MVDFLLELFSEEIPARMQARAAEDLKRLMTGKLVEAQLDFTAATAFVTPRRLALLVEGLPEKQPDRTIEVKGPRQGAPEAALQGFMRSAGAASIDDCELRDTGKGVFHFSVRQVAGLPVDRVLPGLLGAVLDGFPWPKSMRWADNAVRWVRPLHHILAILIGPEGPAALDFEWKLGAGAGIRAADRSAGHRFLAPGSFPVESFDAYRQGLRDRFVMLDAAERRAKVLADGMAKAAERGLILRPDEALLDEVTGLVEWPVVLMGAIEPAFMDLPAEVLTTSMRAHQKYFACETSDGRLAPHFIVVSNNRASDGGAAIIAGNERVLRARLSDAQFFWDQDRRQTLESRVGKLAERVFHAKLGTVFDKVGRMENLLPVLVPAVAGADQALAARAVLLAKADLSSHLVGEFPELQGIMGRYLALNDGENPAVAAAIAGHYAPQGAADATPKAPLDVVVSLADKFDTLTGFFAIDEKPTGSKDPYALRRAALGVIRILLENGIRLPLGEIIRQSLRTLAPALLEYGGMPAHVVEALAARDGEIETGLVDFFADRLKVFLRDEGLRHDHVAAVFALAGEDDLVRVVARTRALAAFLATDDGANLLTAYRRAFKIVQIEEKKDGVLYGQPPDAGALEAAEEIALAHALSEVGDASDRRLAEEDFTGAMAALARLRAPVDEFFEHVTVNAEDPDLRANRLRLLARIWATLNRVADFSKIEG